MAFLLAYIMKDKKCTVVEVRKMGKRGPALEEVGRWEAVNGVLEKKAGGRRSVNCIGVRQTRINLDGRFRSSILIVSSS